MNAAAPIRIALISENPDPDWVWIRDAMAGGRRLVWEMFSTNSAALGQQTGILAAGARRIQSIARFRAGRALAEAAKRNPFDVIVSHGPWPTAWTQSTLGNAKSAARHLAFSFNFTDLPTGPRKALMQRAFQTIDAFAVFTHTEQGLYADYFDLDPKKILRAPWGVAPPLTAPPPRAVDGLYFAVLGGEARDYETLCEAARRCPEEQFVVIARPHNFDGLTPPKNLRVKYNLPPEEAWALVYHAEAALIPLRSRDTPCGLVTLVGGMHLGKAQIVTEAVGVTDYVSHEKTGLLVPPNDGRAMAAAIERLKADPGFTSRLGDNAQRHASAHFSEAATVAFFEKLLDKWFA